MVALPELGSHSATLIRDENADKVLDTVDFRMGINYAYHNRYDAVHTTVDIALLRNEGTEVLLGKKHGATQWRFPGGFADPADACFEDAAGRELQEECGEVITSQMQYVGSVRIDDWRYRNEADKIMTLFYKTDYMAGEVKANDDLAELGWFATDQLLAMIDAKTITAEHHVLVNLLVKNLPVPTPVK